MKRWLALLVLPACAHAMDADPIDDAGSPDALAHEEAGNQAGKDASSANDVANDAMVATEASAIDVMTTQDAGIDANVIDVLTPDASVHQIVFVSSTLFDGNLGGLAGADAKCQALATAASLSGAYKAWLSDTTSSAASRLTHATTPYVLVDSTVVAKDWSGLTSGNLLHAIDLTETGQTPSKGTYGCSSDPSVWSHTDTNGTIVTSAGDCSDWSSTSATTTHAGSSIYTSWAWTNACQLGGTGVCAKTAAIYCIQQ
jgi:hypothetical protein